MTADERQSLISQYKGGYDEVINSLKDFPAAALTAHPLEGKWSACEIVHHLADSETASALRLRKLLTEEHALIQGYDQDEYAVRLRYNERDFAPALEAFHAARANTAQILDRMTDEDWTRAGTHTESGPYSTEDWLRIYALHAPQSRSADRETARLCDHKTDLCLTKTSLASNISLASRNTSRVEQPSRATNECRYSVTEFHF